MGTGIVASVLALIVGAIVYRLYKNKKSGGTGCGCGCSGCSGHCH